MVAVVVLVLAACGEAPPTSSGNAQPANTPGATPNDAASVNCPGSGGPSGGTLTGLGATLGQFRLAHPQDPSYTSDFGGKISGGPMTGCQK